MNIILVGSVYPRYLLDYLLKTGVGADFAANNYQSALLEGFANNGCDTIIISSPPISKPQMCEADILQEKHLSFEESGFSDFYYVGTSRNSIWKMPSEMIRVRRTVKQMLNEKKEENVICTYSLHSPFLLALLSLRKRISKVCVVIPDLPEYMSARGGVLRKIAKTIDRHIIHFCIGRMDCFAVLSKAMVDKLPIKGKPWTLVEGIYRPKEEPVVEKSEKKTILYTGQLQKRYGIFDLVEAFMLIPGDDYELWLCGGTNAEEMRWLEQQAEKDKRIKLMGKVSAERVTNLQKKATLLVNPRHSNEEYTKYSFPSKTMEYLASGTPTLMCKLPSIPEEYYEHLFFFEDESVEGMRDKLMEVCEMEDSVLFEKGKAASHFIKTEKNPIYQVSKIVDMLK